MHIISTVRQLYVYYTFNKILSSDVAPIANSIHQILRDSAESCELLKNVFWPIVDGQ